jgi:hypothetical protein
METNIKNIVIDKITKSTLEGKGNICWDIHVALVQSKYTQQGILVPLDEIHAIWDELNTPAIVEEPPVTEEV